MDNNISEEKLREAKDKLACHIQPPGQAAHTDGSCGQDTAAAGESFIDPDGTVHLTRMTTAGG